MRALIIYCSRHRNNTGRIAEHMAGQMGASLLRVTEIVQAGPGKTAGFDLIGFGSGVYYEDLAPEIFQAAEYFQIAQQKTFVFSTSGAGLRSYNNGLIRLLESKGAVNVGSFACKGQFRAQDFTDNQLFHLLGCLSKGHPGAADFAAAKRFIEGMIPLL